VSGGDPAPAGLSAARASIELLRERVARLPACLREIAPRRWDEAIAALGDDVVVTGVGASAGPARLLAWLLAHRLGVRARFSPVSAFAGAAPPPGRSLAVVSQSLSPNARLALRHAPSFERALVLTSTPPAPHGPARLLAEIEARGGAVVVLPPAEEDGTLLRVVGPAVAAVAACAIVERARGDRDPGASLARLPEVIASAGERALRAAAHVASEALDGPCAFVSVGVDPAALQAHRWKWLEGLRAGEPFGWDLLEVVHGPIQAAAAPMPFLALTSAGDGAAGLIERLGRVLAPGGHPLVELSSALPFPFSFADHDAQLDALLLRVLDERPRDLRTIALPAHDEPLYGLGR
jgi:hypothetical protein